MEYLAGLAVFLIAAWGVYTYNRFVSLGRRAGEAWSGISVQLRRRHDLVPALVSVVKGYAAHEKDLFTEVAKARAEADAAPGPSAALARSETRLDSLVNRLVAVAEAYPELKASESFLALQAALSETEDQLQMARRYYNGTVRNYMILYESFPSLLFPRLFSFQPREYFQLDHDGERAAPVVSL